MSEHDQDSVPVLEELCADETYKELALAFRMAFEQTAGAGNKGIERHALNSDGSQLTYDDQPIAVFSKMFGNGSLYYQAAKKMEETSRLTPEQAMEELKGAMCYIGRAMVNLNQEHGDSLL